MIDNLVQILHDGQYSLVIKNITIRTFNGHGVADLYTLLYEEPEFMKGASLADKIVGKAAALMILGGVKEVFTDIISRPALDLFARSEVRVGYGKVVPHIINRTKTGWCPLETRCFDCFTPQDCFTQIEEFITL